MPGAGGEFAGHGLTCTHAPQPQVSALFTAHGLAKTQQLNNPKPCLRLKRTSNVGKEEERVRFHVMPHLSTSQKLCLVCFPPSRRAKAPGSGWGLGSRAATVWQQPQHRAKATTATASRRQRVVLLHWELTGKAHVELIKIFLTKTFS